MAKKKAIRKEAIPAHVGKRAGETETVRAKMCKNYVWMRIEFRMGKLPTVRLKKMIAEEAEKHGGRVLDSRSASEGFGQKKSITDLEFPYAAAATTCAFEIYRSASDEADCSQWPVFSLEDEIIEIPERQCRDSGTSELIVRLVDR